MAETKKLITIYFETEHLGAFVNRDYFIRGSNMAIAIKVNYTSLTEDKKMVADLLGLKVKQINFVPRKFAQE